MNTSSVAGLAAAELAAGVLPCLLLVGVALLASRRFTAGHTDAADAVTRSLSLRHVLVRGFATGMLIGIATLAPIPFSFAVIIGSAFFAVAAAWWAWRCTAGIPGAFAAVAGLMLGASLVEFLATVVDAVAYGVPSALAASLGVMWMLYAVPGLVLGLVAGWLSGTVAKPAELPEAAPERARRRPRVVSAERS